MSSTFQTPSRSPNPSSSEQGKTQKIAIKSPTIRPPPTSSPHNPQNPRDPRENFNTSSQTSNISSIPETVTLRLIQQPKFAPYLGRSKLIGFDQSVPITSTTQQPNPWIRGPQPFKVLQSAILIISPLCLFIPFVAVDIQKVSGPWAFIVIILLTLLSLITLLLASCTNPGILPRSNLRWNLDIHDHDIPHTATSTASTNNGHYPQNIKYCYTCKIFRPLRSAHCSICDNCIFHLDHHCPWLGTCVGGGNYHFFLWFLYSLMFEIIVSIAINIYALIHVPKHRFDSPTINIGPKWATLTEAFTDYIRTRPYSLILIGYSLLALAMVGWLWGFHLCLGAKSQTTIENIKKTYGKIKGKNPFGRSIWRNVLTLLCPTHKRTTGQSPMRYESVVVADIIMEIEAEIEENDENYENYENIKEKCKNDQECCENDEKYRKNGNLHQSQHHHHRDDRSGHLDPWDSQPDNHSFQNQLLSEGQDSQHHHHQNNQSSRQDSHHHQQNNQSSLQDSPHQQNNQHSSLQDSHQQPNQRSFLQDSNSFIDSMESGSDIDEADRLSSSSSSSNDDNIDDRNDKNRFDRRKNNDEHHKSNIDDRNDTKTRKNDENEPKTRPNGENGHQNDKNVLKNHQNDQNNNSRQLTLKSSTINGHTMTDCDGSGQNDDCSDGCDDDQKNKDHYEDGDDKNRKKKGKQKNEKDDNKNHKDDDDKDKDNEDIDIDDINWVHPDLKQLFSHLHKNHQNSGPIDKNLLKKSKNAKKLINFWSKKNISNYFQDNVDQKRHMYPKPTTPTTSTTSSTIELGDMKKSHQNQQKKVNLEQNLGHNIDIQSDDLNDWIDENKKNFGIESKCIVTECQLQQYNGPDADLIMQNVQFVVDWDY